MGVPVIEQLQANILIFEAVARELAERINNMPTDNQSAEEAELAAVRSHIDKLKRRLEDAERQDR